ncbi:LemA family protein [Paenilisteria rocourtiae]|uniref:LemA protein n=1 Tax=Listeria rocourtiae TaxID=647910 RepID=A0A4R6ZNV7_9LIST|nr:LemA family protein [Listeria rocourtiae]EUJ51811.1 LemA family protein [Listeria rocourtiae FSL F6-920]TDR54203.1 LemA protein [Listeria rocourtiae]
MKKLIWIWSGVVFGLLVLLLVIGITTNNRVIGLEEEISNSKSNISKEEQRRVDLFHNLVDSIESYNKYEQSTLDKIVQARSQSSKGNIEAAEKTISVIVEQYPDLKSQKNYQTAMREFSITENRLAEYRGNYNAMVKTYNRYIRRFPASFILSIIGYDKQDYKYLDFKVDNSQATDLFGGK